MELTKGELESALSPFYRGLRLILDSGTLTAPVSGFIVSDDFAGTADLYRHQDVRQKLRKALGDKADEIGILEPHTEQEMKDMESVGGASA